MSLSSTPATYLGHTNVTLFPAWEPLDQVWSCFCSAHLMWLQCLNKLYHVSRAEYTKNKLSLLHCTIATPESSCGHCHWWVLVSAGRVFSLGDKGRFARAVAVQCTGRNFIFTSDRKKSRPYRVLNSGHTKHEPDVLTPRPPTPR
ncbi:hypothetical protein BsWGS_09028 [Bradybaena similaris]